MKIFIFFITLFILSLEVFSQSAEIQIIHNKEVVGINFITEDSIIGTKYILPDRIYRTYIDTIGRGVSFQLRGLSKNEKWIDNKGSLLLYDLKTEQIQWQININYAMGGIEQYDNNIIVPLQNKSFYIDYKTGEKLWKVKNQIYLVNPIHNIALGYKYNSMTGSTNLLQGLDLKDGSVLWERELDRKYGWQDLYYFNDSTLLLAANGLHAINVKNGLGWDYQADMGIQKNSIGFSVLNDVKSNLIIDSTYIYCASREKLFMLKQEDGSEVWSFSLPLKETAKSRIFMEDSTIYMVNLGLAYMGYREVKQGTPYVAAFDKNTGENKYFNLIDAKNDPVQSLFTKKDSLILAHKKRLEKYSLTDGKKLYEKEIDTKKYGELLVFVGYQNFLKTSENKYESIPTIVPSNNYLMTENEKILVLDEDFNAIDQIELDRLFMHHTNSLHYKFISNENKTVVLDADNYAIAEFESSKHSVLIDKTFYSMYEDYFLEIDLSGLIHHKLPKE